MSDATIALHRFGLGARADEPAPAKPRAWLIDQFAAFVPTLPGAPRTGPVAELLNEYQRLQQLVRQSERGGAMASGAVPENAEVLAMQLRQQGRQHYVGSVGARINAALVTPAPFVERLVHFWANHFAVSADKLVVTALAGPFEFEAIRPHVLGRFADMLMAVERHPAMLLYLDQAQSVGPNSPLGSRIGARQAANGGGRRIGLNENLAREILELHTLGVRTGYAQDDVTELARAMTGWTVAGFIAGLRHGWRDRRQGTRHLRLCRAHARTRRAHDPGPDAMPSRAKRRRAPCWAISRSHPATARHVATKLVRHFVADDPPQARSRAVEGAFLTSGGDLPTVYRALIGLPQAGHRRRAKFAAPWEWSVAALRALGTREVGRSAGGRPVATARPADVAAGIARRLGRQCGDLGRPRCGDAPGGGGRTLRRAHPRPRRPRACRRTVPERRCRRDDRAGDRPRRKPRTGARAAARLARNDAEIM